MVNAKEITISTHMPPNMVAVWNVFQSQYNSIVYHQQIAGGTSRCLAKACTELVTSYHNNMVGHFESRLLSFLYYRLKNIFMSMDPKSLKIIVKGYCYQYVCQPIWPSNAVLSANLTEDRLRDPVN
ncbi:hypothetical protein BCV72DRAFT_326638 [Rhizopus microsporus var. microsporus]|uniref:Uncharacterized protein n=1 Tax=Rhizopus microsporus var. microsporus TaxID=86635 RepID=A0A1X0R600_RHIZD|nr:hypothetical protein BCV72DRAFT_326638 [Rhizopus microsporus var. microsporus]